MLRTVHCYVVLFHTVQLDFQAAIRTVYCSLVLLCTVGQQYTVSMYCFELIFPFWFLSILFVFVSSHLDVSKFIKHIWVVYDMNHLVWTRLSLNFSFNSDLQTVRCLHALLCAVLMQFHFPTLLIILLGLFGVGLLYFYSKVC